MLGLGFLASVLVTASAAVPLGRAVIVVPDAAKPLEKAAADDLSFFLGKVTGRDGGFRIVAERDEPEEGVRVYVGATAAAKAAGVTADGLGPQGFRIRTAKDRVFVVGGSPTGTSYGISDLLAVGFGCYHVDYDTVIAPPNAEPVLPATDIRKEPAILSRTIYSWIRPRWLTPEKRKVQEQILRRNYLFWDDADRSLPGTRPTKRLRHAHNMYEYLPPAQYAKDHPEYYAQREDGSRTLFEKRNFGQLCYSNPEVRRVLKERLVEIIEADRRENPDSPPNLYPFGQGDYCMEHLCWCTNCLVVAAKYGGDSGLLYELVNELAALVRDRWPEIRIGSNAYECTEVPPKGLEIADNVVVQYCDYYGKRCDLQPLSNAVNSAQLDLYLQWAGRTRDLSLWTYQLPNYSQPKMEPGYGVPAVGIDSIIADTALYARTGLKRMFVESEFEGWHPRTFHFLHYFLWAQLLFDPSRDADRLIDVYMDAVYGPAAPEMKEYLAVLRAEQRLRPVTSVHDWRYRYKWPHTGSARLRDRAVELLGRAAKKAAGDVKASARVATEYADALHALALGYLGPKADRSPEVLAEYRRQMRIHFASLPYTDEVKQKYYLENFEKEEREKWLK